MTVLPAEVGNGYSLLAHFGSMILTDSMTAPAPQALTEIVPVLATLNGATKRLLLKLETQCPTGSIKYRTATGLLAEAKAAGSLKRGSLVVESSSGNLALALATLCREQGYEFVAIVDPKTPISTTRALTELGAKTEIVSDPDENGGYLLARIRRAREISEMSVNSVWTDQYKNFANPRAHEASTGPEIFAQCNGKPSEIFVAVSTGGTLAGICNYVNKLGADCAVYGVDNEGSASMGGPSGKRTVPGIGSARVSDFLTEGMYKKACYISEANMVQMCRQLAADTGISVGPSSGAVIAAALMEETRETPVCLCPDGGDRYLDTVYDDKWSADFLARATIHPRFSLDTNNPL